MTEDEPGGPVEGGADEGGTDERPPDRGARGDSRSETETVSPSETPPARPGDADEPMAFGPPGSALAAHSPFNIGFFGALGVLVALALKSVLAAASSVVLLVVVALFLAVGLNPAVELLMRRGVRRGLAVSLVCVTLLLALALFVVTLVPVISDQVQAIVAATPDLVDDLKSNSLMNEVNRRYDLLDQISAQVQNGGIGSQVAGGVLNAGLAVLGALANTLIVAILTLYFLASLPKMKRTAYRLAPSSRRPRVTALGDEILRGVGGYVSGAFVVAMTAGITSLVFLFVVGLGQYAVALAFVVTLFDLVPLIGATIGAIIVSAIGFAEDPKIGLACLVFYIVYQQVENYVIYPRVMSSSVDVPGAVTVVAVLAGGALLGVIGALLAIPMAAAVRLLMREVLIRRQDAL